MTDIKHTLIQLVKFRVASTGKTLGGNNSYQEVDIFADAEILSALELSLRAFNMRPVITYFGWDDEETIDMISDLLVTYAAYILLTRQSLVERGKEFTVNDAGISFNPSDVSSMALNVANEMWRVWETQVHTVKTSPSFYKDFVQDPSEEGEDEEYEE